MDHLLDGLRACAEPTRLRLLALAERGVFCVMDFTDILGQSQPRLSRHLRLLCEADMLERVREGVNVWFTLASAQSARGSLARALLARVPDGDPVIEADRRQAARVLSERARAASDVFRRRGADWNEMRALNLPAQAVGDALLGLLPASVGRLLDIGTGTGQLLESLAPRIAQGTGIDASRTMLALARTRLSKPGLQHCAVRLADMYRLPLADAAFDAVVLQMVLHYAEDPQAALTEAARVLRPGGALVVVDLARHGPDEQIDRLAHRWPGFSDPAMNDFLTGAGLASGEMVSVPGPFEVRVWSASKRAPVHEPAFASAHVEAIR